MLSPPTCFVVCVFFAPRGGRGGGDIVWVGNRLPYDLMLIFSNKKIGEVHATSLCKFYISME